MSTTAITATLAVAALIAAFGFQAIRPSTVVTSTKGVGTHPGGIGISDTLKPTGKNQLAIFAGGCFWGTESSFRELPGVVGTAVGYTGGHTKNPTYEDVCSHTTGHAEGTLVEFDPAKVTYRQLVDKFWELHNPTTMNRQGPDVGSNYRSAIFFFSPEQQKEAIASRDAYQKTIGPKHKIVTEITAATKFYMAEEYHQQYHEKTGTLACPIDKIGG